MQNKYAGDIGDFGKFGLLRYLLKGTDLSLAVNWYLFPDENNNDGKHTHYLKKDKFEQFDSDLFHPLKKA